MNSLYVISIMRSICDKNWCDNTTWIMLTEVACSFFTIGVLFSFRLSVMNILANTHIHKSQGGQGGRGGSATATSVYGDAQAAAGHGGGGGGSTISILMYPDFKKFKRYKILSGIGIVLGIIPSIIDLVLYIRNL